MKFWWFQFWTITLTPGCYVPAVPKILDAELEIFVEKNYRLVLTGVISARAGHTVKQHCSCGAPRPYKIISAHKYEYGKRVHNIP